MPRQSKGRNIEYEQPHEDAIVEIISRMDELGDEVDGHITPVETVRLKGLLNDR